MKKTCCCCGKDISDKSLFKKEGYKINRKSYVCDECYSIAGFGNKFKSEEEFMSAYKRSLQIESEGLKGLEKASLFSKILNILSWIIVVFLLLLTFGTKGPSTILMILSAVLAAPINIFKSLKSN